VIASCSSENSPESLKESITEKEEAVKALPSTADNFDKRDTMRLELVDALLDFYHAYPEDSYAPECLDKVHLIYSAMRDYRMAAKYGDTILINYPDYVNKEMIIESQYNTYDMFVTPRNAEKAKYYLELWLKEFPDMPKEKKEEIEFRLKYISLPLEKVIELQNNENS
jgi:hypothetical protein